MSNRPWMPLYVADYRADTAHLNAAQHGAYLLLIMHYWTTGGLPADDAPLARIACMTTAEWRRARPTIATFFSADWRHKRIDAELARITDISSKRRASAVQRHSKSNAIAEQLDTHSHSHSHSHSPREETSLRSVSTESDWPNDFREQFWAKYPRKTGKAGALRKLEIVRRSGAVPFAKLTGALDRYAAENPDLKFVKHPETWLSKGCWDDEPSNPPRAPPDAKPSYLTAPPGMESLESFHARYAAAKKATNGQTTGTEVRSDPGGGEARPDKPAELPLSR